MGRGSWSVTRRTEAPPKCPCGCFAGGRGTWLAARSPGFSPWPGGPLRVAQFGCCSQDPPRGRTAVEGDVLQFCRFHIFHGSQTTGTKKENRQAVLVQVRAGFAEPRSRRRGTRGAVRTHPPAPARPLTARSPHSRALGTSCPSRPLVICTSRWLVAASGTNIFKIMFNRRKKEVPRSQTAHTARSFPRLPQRDGHPITPAVTVGVGAFGHFPKSKDRELLPPPCPSR